MPISLNTSLSALNATRSLNVTTRAASQGLERLSSGLRLNRASDDPAGLSIRETMRAEISRLRQAVRNAEQATNLVQTAEGSLNEVNAVLIRMCELATQSSSGTITDSNRTLLQAEFSQLVLEIDRITASGASVSDADVVAEVTNLTRAQILSQTAAAMLAQANAQPQSALLALAFSRPQLHQ